MCPRSKEELAKALLERGAEQKGRDRSVVTHH